jgi:catechol 2,3-dioxygenase-like lactoylglutathione lyase family enzyme
MALPPDAQTCCFILTGDRARARPFYEHILGLTVIGDDPHALTFDTGDGTPLRLTDHPGHEPSPHTVLGWNVTDIEAAVTDLAGQGVACLIYEGFGQDELGIWSAPDGAAKVAWFADPDGNVLSFTQFG